ncbi:MAG: 5,6-dimethylbenzimidazole synthase [Alphaproteobacteria bacterium]|nr:5,6-dimethylbenzimidazole synthase [Alphaproteobacteria bacterium]
MPGQTPPEFDKSFQEKLDSLLRWRRDVRRFRRDPLPDGTLEALVERACLAPSVGNSQPWRFVRVRDGARRATVRAEFERANADALAAQAPEDRTTYTRLKLAGLDRAPEQIAVFCDESTAAGRGLGRRTMPETLRYSAVGAVFALWLAARARGIGVGWVSILEPARMNAILDAPAEWTFVAYLCVGYPEIEDDAPELERAGWQARDERAARILDR